AFLTSMYTNRADFVFTVSREFVRSIQTPLLIAPDDVPAHPYKVAMEVASLAPNAEVQPWFDDAEVRRRLGDRSWPARAIDLAAIRCLAGAGFAPTAAAPDWEGMQPFALRPAPRAVG